MKPPRKFYAFARKLEAQYEVIVCSINYPYVEIFSNQDLTRSKTFYVTANGKWFTQEGAKLEKPLKNMIGELVE